MAFNEERIPKFIHVDEEDKSKENTLILFGFEQELKSITVRHGDSARFEAKIRLLSTTSNIQIDRSLLNIQWRLNDIPIISDEKSRYRFDSLPGENLYWMDIRQCEQEDEGVYTISISYDHEKFHDESSAYLFVDSFITEKEEQPDQISQQDLSADDTWHSATSLDRFIPPTITRPLQSIYRCSPNKKLQLQVEYFSPSVQCHCTWQVQYLNSIAPQPVQDSSIINTNYSSILTINSMTSQLQGTYIFHVENVYGRAMTQTHVIVDKDSSDDELEYQEVSEEPIMKTQTVDDNSYLQVIGSQGKSTSVLHQMPLNETNEYEEIKVHIPGGETDDINIHTEHTPPTTILSTYNDQSIHMPITEDISNDTYEIEDTITTITLNKSQSKFEIQSQNETKFMQPSTSTTTETVETYSYEDIPQTTEATVDKSSSQSANNYITTTRTTEIISSAPDSFYEDLSNANQWSDFIPEGNNFSSTSSFLSSSRASHISNALPSVNEHEYEQYVAHPIDQRLAIASSGISGQALTISQPTVAADYPLLDQTGMSINQFRRSEAAQSYEYKSSADIQQESGAPKRTTAMSTGALDEEPVETSINISHMHQQQSSGTKQKATSISQPSVTTDFPILDETAVQLDQLQRSGLPQSVTYKPSTNIQQSERSILTTTSVFGQEEPAEETSITFNQFTQPILKTSSEYSLSQQQASSTLQPSTAIDLPILDETTIHKTTLPLDQEEFTHLPQITGKDISSFEATKQHATSVIQPSASTDLPILDETSVHLSQLHRSDVPQKIQYKAPTDIQPSIGTIHKTTSALSQEESSQDTSVNVGQLRQPSATGYSTTEVTKQQLSSIIQPTTITDISTLDETTIHLDHLPTTDTTLKTTKSLSQEKSSQVSPIIQRSTATDLPILDETAVHLDQIQRTDTPQAFQYKAPAGIQPSAATIHKTASTLSQEDSSQETSVNVGQLRQPSVKGLPTTELPRQRASSILQPSAATDLPILDETAVHLGQIQRTDTPQAFQYKAPAGIQPSTGTIHKTALALSQEESSQDTSVNVGQLRQPSATGYSTTEVTKQQESSITQPTTVSDLSTLDETTIHLDQVPSTYTQQSTDTTLTTTSTFTQETTISVDQLPQSSSKDLPITELPRQRASSILQPSTATDLPILDETAVHLGQLQRTDTPQAVQYKAPAGIQPSTGTIHKTALALSQEESSQDTSVNVGQLRQPSAKGVPTPEVKPSTVTDLPISDETSVHLDQVPPTYTQPSADTIIKTTPALGQEESLLETSFNINQLPQPSASGYSITEVTEQQVLSVIQPSATTDLPILDETTVHLDQIHRTDTPQTIQYKAPADIQPSTGSLILSTSATGAEELPSEQSIMVGQMRQQQPQATKQQATSVSQPSFATDVPIFDESAIQLDQIQRSQLSQSVEQKTSTTIQSSTVSNVESTSTDLTQISRPIAENQITSDAIQPSTVTDLRISDETTIHRDQIQPSIIPQTIEDKAPSDRESSAGTIHKTVSALGQEESSEETSIKVSQLRQPSAKDLPKQQETSAVQPSAVSDLTISNETTVQVDQVQPSVKPQVAQEKTPADRESSAGTINKTISAFSQQESSEETSINVSQLRQPSAKDLPTTEETKQQETSTIKSTAVTEVPISDETTAHVDEVQTSTIPAEQPKVPEASKAAEQPKPVEQQEQVEQPKAAESTKQTEQPKVVEVPKPAEETKVAEAPKPVEQPTPVEQQKQVEQPKAAESTKQTEQPKVVEVPKPAEQPKVVEVPKPAEETKVVEVPNPAEQPKVAEAPKTAEETKVHEEPKPVEQPKVVEATKPVEETKVVEAPKPAEEQKVAAAPISVEQPKVAEASKPAEETKPTDVPKPVEQPKVVEAPKPAEEQKVAEAPKPVEQPKVIEVPKPAEETTVAEVLKSVEQQKQVEQPKVAESAKPTEETKVVETPKPVEQPKVIEVPKPAEETTVAEVLKSVEQQKQVEQPKVAESTKPVEETKVVEVPKPAEQPKVAEAPKAAEQPKVVEATKPVEETKVVEAPKPVEEQKVAEAPKPVEQPKVAEIPKPAEVTKVVETPKPVEQQKAVEATKSAEQAEVVELPKTVEQQKPVEQPKADEAPKLPQPVQENAPTDIKPSVDAILKTTSTVDQEEPSQET
ncbi:unnamed protein product, partial [Adineta steineri]